MLQFDISLGLGMKYDFGWVYDSALLLPAQGPQLNCLDLYVDQCVYVHATIYMNNEYQFSTVLLIFNDIRW